MTAEICSRARACRLSSPLSNRSFRDGSSRDWCNSSRHSSFTSWNHRGGEFHSGKQCNPLLRLLDAPSHASVIVCVWLHMCAYASAYMCIWMCLYLCVHCGFIFVYICICVFIFVSMCVYMCYYICAYMYLCSCTYICVCICMCF